MATKRYCGIQGFKLTDVTYHRNGVCGRPFYSVRFSFDNEGKFMPNMLAVMPHGEELHPSGRDGTECYVVDLNNPGECWRGDGFSSLVGGAIAEYTRESEARFKTLVAKKAV